MGIVSGSGGIIANMKRGAHRQEFISFNEL
jgi:hypothetical protein